MTVPFITVFTPAYNRRAYLRRLYESLHTQTMVAFEWLIVDDGSTDGTSEEIDSFIAEGKFPIRYYYQENAGKHIAINKGVLLAAGELFFIVDSDDMLRAGALSTIIAQWESVLKLPNSASFAGVCGLRVYGDGSVIGGSVDYDVLDVSAIDYRFKLRYQGDRAEVIRTDIMKQFPYPSFSGERFCADAVVWNRIAMTYRLRFFNEGVYICEYLPGGITDTSVRLRQLSPRGASLYYAEMAALPRLTTGQRIRAVVNFWRFALYNHRDKFGEKYRLINRPWSLIVFPVCYFLYCFDNLFKK